LALPKTKSVSFELIGGPNFTMPSYFIKGIYSSGMTVTSQSSNGFDIIPSIKKQFSNNLFYSLGLFFFTSSYTENLNQGNFYYLNLKNYYLGIPISIGYYKSLKNWSFSLALDIELASLLITDIGYGLSTHPTNSTYGSIGSYLEVGYKLNNRYSLIFQPSYNRLMPFTTLENEYNAYNIFAANIGFKRTFDKNYKTNGKTNPEDTTIQILSEQKWTWSVSLAPNNSMQLINANSYTYEYPFTNSSRFGFGIDFLARHGVSQSLNFITGFSCDAISFQFQNNGIYKQNGLTYYSLSIPALLEYRSQIDKHTFFNFKFGFKLGFIANASDINGSTSFQGSYTGAYFTATSGYNLVDGGFVLDGVIGCGIQFKITEKLSLYLEPEFTQAIHPLTYYFHNSNSQDYDDITHYIEFFKLLSVEYKF
jgi:hypothetical protein